MPSHRCFLQFRTKVLHPMFNIFQTFIFIFRTQQKEELLHHDCIVLLGAGPIFMTGHCILLISPEKRDFIPCELPNNSIHITYSMDSCQLGTEMKKKFGN